MILGAACLLSCSSSCGRDATGGAFVTATSSAACGVPTLLFARCSGSGYVASFFAGFMRFVERMALWKSLLAGFLFSIIMFVTFDVAFDVIMPKGPLEAFFGH
jgi:hypothetical protein